jgi:hypothetical protein
LTSILRSPSNFSFSKKVRPVLGEDPEETRSSRGKKTVPRSAGAEAIGREEETQAKEKILQKALEENGNYGKTAKKKWILKKEQTEENHEALAVIIECLQEKDTCCPDV